MREEHIELYEEMPFYKKYHNLEFKDAVKELAQKVGIEIDSGNYNKEEYDKKWE